MKKMKPVLWAVAAAAAVLLSFKTWNQDGGTIKGSVKPSNGATEVKVYAGTDSFSSAVTYGTFEVNNLKAGTYKLKLVAVPPYKDYWRDEITLTEDKPVINLGEVQLEKQTP